MGVDSIGVLGVKVSEFLLGLGLDFRTGFPEFIGQTGAVPRDVFQHHLEDQAGDRVEVAREGVAAQPQGLQRDGTTPGEGVHH